MRPHSNIEIKIFSCLLFLSTLSISPWISVEPINAIKFLWLMVMACFTLESIYFNLSEIKVKIYQHKTLVFSILFFTLGILSSFFNSHTNWRQSFFGLSGRNMGILTFLAFIVIFLWVTLLMNQIFDEAVLKILISTGLLTGFYGTIQFLGLDPIRWNNKYSNQIGFFGNPNFQSAFLGIYSILLIHMLFNRKKIRFHSILILVNLGTNFFLILNSSSIQGLYVFCAGGVVLILDKVYQSKFRGLTSLLVTLIVILGILTILGFLQKGPLASLYQSSISFRGDYWRAGTRMFKDNIFFGVGNSSFGDFYRAYRDVAALERRLDGTITNSAHNIFIDLGAEGGILVVGPFIFLVVYTVYKFLIGYKKDDSKGRLLVLYFALWLGFISQALISVQFLPLFLWGWIFTAIVLRIASNSLIRTKCQPAGTTLQSYYKFKGTRHRRLMRVNLSVILGLLIGFLPLRASVVEKSSYESKNLNQIISAAYTELKDSNRMVMISSILLRNGYNQNARELARAAVTLNNRNYDGWRLVNYLSPANSNEKIKARLKMKEIDPLITQEDG